MSWCISSCVYPVWDSLCLLDLIDFSFPWLTRFLFHVVEIFNYNLFKVFLIPFLFLFFFWDPYNSNVGAFDMVPDVSETVLSSFHSLLYSALQKLFPPFYLPAHWFIVLLQIFCYWFLLEYFSEKAMAPHSSTLAWKIPWTGEPGRLQSMGSWRAGHDWANSLSLFTFMHWRTKWQPTPVFLPGESQGQRSLVGCLL